MKFSTGVLYKTLFSKRQFREKPDRKGHNFEECKENSSVKKPDNLKVRVPR